MSQSIEDSTWFDENEQSNKSIEVCDKTKKKTLGRAKIKTEFIKNKTRRYTTFSKRKAGLMKKTFELATLTGTEVMLLVASETGHVYTYTTAKLKPILNSETGKVWIQACLAKDEASIPMTTETLNSNDVTLTNENQEFHSSLP